MMRRWNQLNRLIPKRSMLLLCYYLPFFKKPKPFYFTLREFIDRKVNNKKTKVSNLSLFSEFLTILHEAPIDDAFRKKLILCVLPSDVEGNESSLTIFDAYLNDFYSDLEVQSRSEAPVFIDYKSQIACCEKLKDKFTMEGKLRILTLLSDNVIEQNRKSVSTFAMHEVEKVLPCLSALKEINPALKKKVLKFYLHELKTDHQLYLDFLTEYFILDQKNAFSTLMLSEEESLQWRPIVIKKIKDNFALYLENSTEFFTENLQEVCSMLDLSNKEQLEIINKMYEGVPDEEKESSLAQWLDNHQEIVSQGCFINHLITSVLSDKSKIEFLILKRMLNNVDCYRLNSFQILAIQRVLNISPIPEEYANVGKVFSSDSPALHLNELDLPDKREVPAKIQNFVIEYGIHSLHPIVQSIISTLPKRAEKNSLHSYWGRFTNNRWVDVNISKCSQWKIIEHKIRKEYPDKITGAIDKILFAYGNLYSLLDLKEATAKEIAVYRDNDQRTKEENYKAEIREIRAEFFKMIKSRQISNVSEEFIKELYGEDAEKTKSLFSRQYGVNFFTENDLEAKTEAFREAQLIIHFRRV